MSISIFARIFFAAVAFVSVAQAADLKTSDFPPAVELQAAPREVLQAVGLRARVSQNQLTSDLEGRTSGHLVIELSADTRGKFHLYEDRFLVWTENQAGKEAWPVTVVGKPEPHMFMDPVTHTLKPGYRGESIFVIEAKLPESLKSAPLDRSFKLPLVVGFQACSDKVCLLPIALRFDVALSETSAPPEANFFDSLTKKVSASLGGNDGLSLTTLFVILLAGLITAFTPCVYPLYPITLGLFSRWSQHAHVSAFLLTLVYCSGIVLSYAVLGVVSVATGSLFGSLTQTPGFLLGMGLFILFSAFVFSGAVQIPLFDRMQALFSKPLSDSAKPLTVIAHAGLMGASLGIVASPCVGPVLVVILAWVGTQIQQTGAAAYLAGFAYLALFGAGMSLPFLVLGHVILRMGKHPRLGKYTPVFKNIGTVLMVVASLFFLVPGAKLMLKSEARKADYQVHSIVTWQKDKPAVIDFRADWCVACLELEANTFTHPEVAALFKKQEWDFVRVDMTALSEENRKIAADYNVIGLPTVLIFDGNGRACNDLRLVGFEGPQEFLKRMRQAMQGCK